MDVFVKQRKFGGTGTDNETNEESEFLIKQIHDMQFENLTQDFILQAMENNNSSPELDQIQLYFFADMCYLMNFDCKCSKFTTHSVANII